MATFVNDTNVMVERWGGYLPCLNYGDCLLPGELLYDLVVICNPIATGPIKSQAYCHCDMGLSGYDCADVTPAAIKRAVTALLLAVVGAVTTVLCIREILARRGSFKMIPVNVSLLFSTLGSVANFLWGALCIYFVSTAPNLPGFAVPRAFYTNVVVPTTMASGLSGAMVISLAWRKVVNDPQIRGNTKNNPAREKQIRNLVVVLCASVFVPCSLLLLLVNITVAALFLTVLYLISGFIFIWFGRSFLKYVTSVAKSAPSETHEPNATAVHMHMCLTAAICARRTITRGMFVVVLSSIFLVLTQNKIGAPGSPDGYEVSSLGLLGLSIGAGLIPFAVAKYARTVRRAGLTRKKSKASKSRVTAATSSAASSALAPSSRVQPAN